MRVRSSESSVLGFMADRFDVVAVRTNDESRVVVRVIVRTQTRWTIVLASCLQRCSIEGFNLLSILGHEREVKTSPLVLGLEDAQRSVAVWAAKLDTVRRLPFRNDSYAEGFECPAK